ncbi:hypothetical protein MMC12_001556 [Toensbergia leucococca]|nr:hypothetical protein [Toensbergia leucococca]
MCWPQIVGGIEVEERRPRYEGESRRKRLNFVKSHSPRNSDEWALTRGAYPGQQFRQEMLQAQQWQAQQLLARQEQHWREWQHQQQWLAQHHQQQQVAHQQHPQGRIEGGTPGIIPLRGGQFDEHNHDDHDDHHDDHRGRERIRYIEEEPRKVVIMPRGMKYGKSRSKSRGRDGKHRHTSVYSYDDDNDSLRSGKYSRGTRSVYTIGSNDSFDDLPPLRVRTVRRR